MEFENINVALRLRPLNEIEINNGEFNIWEIGRKHIQVQKNLMKQIEQNKKDQNIKLQYIFDECFNQTQTTQQIYDSFVKRIIYSSLNGINGTIFAFGQTNSGKTHTLVGKEFDNYQQKKKQMNRKTINQEQVQFEISSLLSHQYEFHQNQGLIQMALKDLFEAIQNDDQKIYEIECQYMEIHNDKVYDILVFKNEKQELQIFENENQEFLIKGLTHVNLQEYSDIHQVLIDGELNRLQEESIFNDSPRSHTILRINIRAYSSDKILKYRLENTDLSNINDPQLKQLVISEKDEFTIIRESQLNFIDLSGNDKSQDVQEEFKKYSNDDIRKDNTKQRTSANLILKKTNEFNKTQNKLKQSAEGCNINKSLFYLTQVITKRSEANPSIHIPYRNSAITKILKTALGGNSRTLIVVCAIPSLSQYENTQSSIRFGQQARKIENQIFINIKSNVNNHLSKDFIKLIEQRIQFQERQMGDPQIEIQSLKQEISQLKQIITQNQQNQMQKFQNEQDKINYEQQLSKAQKEFHFQRRQLIQEKDELFNKYNQLLNENDMLKERIKNNNLNNFQINQQNTKKENIDYYHLDHVGIIHQQANINQKNRLKQNWQDLIYDFQGKMVFNNFHSLRNFYLQQTQQQMSDIQQIKVETILEYESFKEYCIKILQKINQNYENIVKQFKCQEKQLQIYEKYSFKDLDTNQLQIIENKFFQGILALKSESCKRQLKEQIKLYNIKNNIQIDESHFINQDEQIINHNLNEINFEDIKNQVNDYKIVIKLDELLFENYENIKKSIFQYDQKMEGIIMWENQNFQKIKKLIQDYSSQNNSTEDQYNLIDYQELSNYDNSI